jgi:hypothetical protein
MIIVVALVLLTIGLSIAALILYAQRMQAERLQAALKAEKDRLLNEEQKLNKQKNDAYPPSGFQPEGGMLPTTQVAEKAAETRKVYWSVERMNSYPTLGGKTQGQTKLSEEHASVWQTSAGQSDLFTTLQDQVALAAAWVYLYKNRAEQLQLELESAKGQVAECQKAQPDINVKRKARITDLQERIQKVSQQTAEENSAFNDRKNQLVEARAKAEEESEKEQQVFHQYEIRINHETRELRRQLEVLKVKEVIKHEITSVHGRIIRPDIPNKIAFINIGSRERVVPGLKFLVGRKGVQGKFNYKGKIEVKKVWMTLSEVAILTVNDTTNHPIVEGDYLVNPLFSKERPIVVTFAGEKNPPRLRYSVDEATRRLREIGSEVRPKLTLDVDYVIFTDVAGKKTPLDYDVYEKAVFLEIPVAEAGGEEGLFRFLED